MNLKSDICDPPVTAGAGLLARATSDKNWIVRASALLAIGKREDPDLLSAIGAAMSDKNQVVRFTAAAALIRLTTVAARSKDTNDARCVLGSKSTDQAASMRQGLGKR